MDRKVYIFNPQNDLALATGGINYVAPPFAMQMATDLAILPAYIAEPGSLLITDSDHDAQWLEQLNATMGFDVHAVKRNELRYLNDYCVMPWGWCLDLRRRLLKWGASSDSMPSKDEIYYLRGLSHRRISVLIHLRLQEILGRKLCPAPVELATPELVLAFVKKHKQCFVKTPWSSSGRGIYHTTDGPTPELEQWCRGALKRQGSVLCEEALDKMMDLGVEFYSDNGKAEVRGYSVFETDSHSQYSYGIVASKKELKSRITKLYPKFDEVVAAVTQVLDELVAPHYNGWLGVDMLLFNNVQSSTKYKVGSRKSVSSSITAQSLENVGIDPCVELNLRPTMGAITSVLGNKLLAPDAEAKFIIEQRSSNSDPWPQSRESVIENGRLVAGTLQLTTPSPTALYRAVLKVEK